MSGKKIEIKEQRLCLLEWNASLSPNPRQRGSQGRCTYPLSAGTPFAFSKPQSHGRIPTRLAADHYEMFYGVKTVWSETRRLMESTAPQPPCRQSVSFYHTSPLGDLKTAWLNTCTRSLSSASISARSLSRMYRTA